jgi:glucuronyl/N-acetylglucosaminyl transferase EXT2
MRRPVFGSHLEEDSELPTFGNNENDNSTIPQRRSNSTHRKRRKRKAIPLSLYVHTRGVTSFHPTIVRTFHVFALTMVFAIHVYLFRAVFRETATSEEATILPSRNDHEEADTSGVVKDLQNLRPDHNHEMNNTKSLEPLLRDIDMEQFTVRVNTWKRLEQLRVSTIHHASCPGVAQVQVVWCEAQGEPPSWLLTLNDKIVIERHSVNSLNERFHMLVEPPTIGILSIDDDVLRPCLALDAGFVRWTQHPDRMVGFDARSHTVQGKKHGGSWAYGYLSTTERTNRYSMTLTRYAFLHRDYLRSYTNDLPPSIRSYIDEHFNCEDIAMTFWVSSHTNGQPPLLADFWAVKSQVKLYSDAAISSTSDHKAIRDICVDRFATLLKLKHHLEPAIFVRNSGFECGADAGAAASLADHHGYERRQSLESTISRWKSAGPEVMIRELTSMRGDTSKEAFEAGLLKDTDPWKKRFRHKHK